MAEAKSSADAWKPMIPANADHAPLKMFPARHIDAEAACS
jgi:hypothetical protein